MKQLTVLITACGAQFIPGLVNCLRDNGERDIKLIGVDMEYDDTIVGLFDCMYEVPKVSEPNYVDSILTICNYEKVDVVLPVMSAELLPLLMHKSSFDKIGTKLAITDEKSVRACVNKLHLYVYLSSRGIAIPKFHPVRHVSELKKAFEYIGYPHTPVCIKSTELSGSRGIRIVDPTKSRFDILFGEKPNSMFTTYEELEATLKERGEIPEMMAMEYLPGEEGSIDLIADQGKILYMAYRQSNINLASIPQVATLVENVEACNIATEVIAALGLTGSADLDFRYDCNGKPALMEINPRTAATMRIFKEGGLNLPYLRIKQALGEKLPKVDVRYGVKMKRRYLELFSK